MKKHLALFLAIIGLVTLGAGAEQATAQGNGNGNDKGNGTVQSSEEFTFISWNPCCEEYVQISMTYHYAYNPKTGKNHANFQGMTGESVEWDETAEEWVPTGNTYHGNQVRNITNSYDEETDSFSGRRHFKQRYSNSDGCGYTVHFLSTWTWTPEDGYQTEIKIDKVVCDNGEEIG